MASDAQIIANRKNAKRATGPTSTAGKIRSSRNALKHGLYVKPPVVPGEDAREYRDELDRWNDHYRPDGPAAALLVERAAHAAWRLRRCARAEAAHLARSARDAVARFVRDESERAERLGQQLLATGVSHLLQRKSPVDLGDLGNPAALHRELCSFAAGADWLLGRWRTLLADLDGGGKWEPFHCYSAVALLGKYCVHAVTDPVLSGLFVACHAAAPPAWDLWHDFYRASAAGDGRPGYHDRVAALAQSLPDAATARGALRALARGEVARLEGLKATGLDALAAADRAEAPARALFDDTGASASQRRYEAACSTELHRALRALGRMPAAVPENETIAEVEEESDVPSEAAEDVAAAPVAERAADGPSPDPARREGPSPRPSPRRAGRAGQTGDGVGDVRKNESIAEVEVKSGLSSDRAGRPRRPSAAELARRARRAEARGGRKNETRGPERDRVGAGGPSVARL